MNTVQIGDTLVGPGQPTYVIAEIGGNHDDSLDQACVLIEAAAAAGADAAKFQLFNPWTLYPDRATPGAIPADWLKPLQDSCRYNAIEFLCSVFDLETLHTYLEIQPAAIKIASPEATNRDLVDAAFMSGLPVIVSTGAMTWKQVDQMAVAPPMILLHCVSAYPAAQDEMNLRVIPEMITRYHVPVGLSDHTAEAVVASCTAVAAGAAVIEKHLTLDKTLPGPDHSFALTPHEFRALINCIEQTEFLLGDGVKRVQPSEDPTDRR